MFQNLLVVSDPLTPAGSKDCWYITANDYSRVSASPQAVFYQKTAFKPFLLRELPRPGMRRKDLLHRFGLPQSAGAFFHDPTGNHDLVSASEAFQPEIRSDAENSPLKAPARVLLLQFYDIADFILHFRFLRSNSAFHALFHACFFSRYRWFSAGPS